MAGYDGRATKFPLTLVRGADMAFTVTATDDAGDPIDLSTATIAAELYGGDGSVADTLTTAVSGAGSNIITVSFTDTETTALTADNYAWTLWVTRGADKRAWLAGPARITDATNGGGATTGDSSLVLGGDVTVAVTVAAVGLLAAAPAISSGSGAPSSTPEKAGDIYVDTVGGSAWIATGSASPANWTALLNV